MIKKLTIVALAATYLTACTTTDPYTGEQKMSNTAAVRCWVRRWVPSAAQ